MTAAGYVLAVALRSRRVICAALALAIVDALLYAEPADHALSGVAAVAVYSIPIYAWLGLAVLNALSPADRHILRAVLGTTATGRARLLAALLVASAAALLSVVYPLAAGRFMTSPTPAEFGVSLLVAVVAATAATALAAVFAAPAVSDGALAPIALALCVLAGAAVHLPPIPLARAVSHAATGVVPGAVWPDLLEMAAFTVVAAAASAAVWRRAAG